MDLVGVSHFQTGPTDPTGPDAPTSTTQQQLGNLASHYQAQPPN